MGDLRLRQKRYKQSCKTNTLYGRVGRQRVRACASVKGEGSIIDEKGRVYPPPRRHDDNNNDLWPNITATLLQAGVYQRLFDLAMEILFWSRGRYRCGHIATTLLQTVEFSHCRWPAENEAEKRERRRRFTTTQGTRDQDCGNSAILMGTLTQPRAGDT